MENFRLLELDDTINFGKYKGKTIREVIGIDWQYIKWATIDSQNLLANVDQITKYHESIGRLLSPDSVISFGKYKGQTIAEIRQNDLQYLQWMEECNEDFRIDWEAFH